RHAPPPPIPARRGPCSPYPAYARGAGADESAPRQSPVRYHRRDRNADPASACGWRKEPDTLASYRDPSCKSSAQVIRESLKGNYQEEHLFPLRQSLELYDYHTTMIQQCDREIEQKYRALPSRVDLQRKPLPPSKKQQKKPRK